jgi:hypothetical protein
MAINGKPASCHLSAGISRVSNAPDRIPGTLACNAAQSLGAASEPYSDRYQVVQRVAWNLYPTNSENIGYMTLSSSLKLKRKFHANAYIIMYTTGIIIKVP